jgi:hypothetical protein
MARKTDSESVVREIRRKTRRKYSSEEKIHGFPAKLLPAGTPCRSGDTAGFQSLTLVARRSTVERLMTVRAKILRNPSAQAQCASVSV